MVYNSAGLVENLCGSRILTDGASTQLTCFSDNPPPNRAGEKVKQIGNFQAAIQLLNVEGIFTSDEQRPEQRQAELTRCQQKLKAEKDRSATFRQKLSRQEQLRLPLNPVTTTSLVEPRGPVRAEGRPADDPAYVIKHTGRLVHDEKGVGRFVGSTTGVHFVLTVEQECQKALDLSGMFPESCFRLFLVELSPSRGSSLATIFSDKHEMIRQCLADPSVHHCQQADAFHPEMGSILSHPCEKTTHDRYTGFNDRIMIAKYSPGGHGAIDYSTILTLLMILNIHESAADATNQLHEQSLDSLNRLSLAHSLIEKVVSQENLMSLQAFVPFGALQPTKGSPSDSHNPQRHDYLPEDASGTSGEIASIEKSLERTAQSAACLQDLLKMGEDRLLYRFFICILLYFFSADIGRDFASVYSSVIFEQGLGLGAETSRILSGGTLTWKFPLVLCILLRHR
ncbi:hypothetical protein PDIDSM_1756 [Penicillium digitatum]|nr:hypothetical protein PDIDSM_1756 [Penicillium digitatum]